MKKAKTRALQPPRDRNKDEPLLREFEHANLRIQRRMLLATSIVAAVTAIYVTITLLQYFALREQIADARRSGDLALRETRNAQRVDQRAWIGVSKVAPPKSLSDPILMSVSFANSGKTPALAVKMMLHVLILPAGNHDIIASHLDEEPKTRMDGPNDFIFPGVTDTIEGWPFDEHGRRTTLTAQQIAAIEAGTLTIYGHGRVEYQDIFGGAHWLTFCVYWDGEIHDYSACDRGNASDDVAQSATEPAPLTFMTLGHDNGQKHIVRPHRSPVARNGAPQPTLRAASVTVMADHGYPNPGVHIAATLFSASGAVIGETSPAEMTFAKNGDVTCNFRLLPGVGKGIGKNDSIYLRLITMPPPTEMLGSIQWWFYWSDGTKASRSVNTSALPAADGVWPLLHASPIDDENFVNPFPP